MLLCIVQASIVENVIDVKKECDYPAGAPGEGQKNIFSLFTFPSSKRMKEKDFKNNAVAIRGTQSQITSTLCV